MNWTLAPGDVLAHYRVLSPLGAGGMGQVFLAEDVRLGRKLALKVLAPPTATAAEEGIARFEREARSISALNHPNIITIYDTGQARGLRFIATEFIDGVTLRTLLRAAVSSRAGRSTSPPRWRRHWSPRTPPASCTATSSPRT